MKDEVREQLEADSDLVGGDRGGDHAPLGVGFCRNAPAGRTQRLRDLLRRASGRAALQESGRRYRKARLVRGLESFARREEQQPYGDERLTRVPYDDDAQVIGERLLLERGDSAGRGVGRRGLGVRLGGG